jgi:flagellar hook assembly protein FlgD
MLYAAPMPFNSTTKIHFRVPSHSSRAWGNSASRAVYISIFDIKGNLVKTLVNDVRNRGTYSAVWNGTDYKGKRVSAGLYLVRMNGGHMKKSMKIVVNR